MLRGIYLSYGTGVGFGCVRVFHVLGHAHALFGARVVHRGGSLGTGTSVGFGYVSVYHVLGLAYADIGARLSSSHEIFFSELTFLDGSVVSYHLLYTSFITPLLSSSFSISYQFQLSFRLLLSSSIPYIPLLCLSYI